jgi:hypothetical protein
MYSIALFDLGGYVKLSLVKRFNQKSGGKEKGFGLAGKIRVEIKADGCAYTLI